MMRTTATAMVLTLGVVGAVSALLWCEARERRSFATLWKLVASVGFVALSLDLGALRHGTATRLIVVGLSLSAAGDGALALRGHGPFAVGLGLFLLAHVAYAVAFGELAPVTMWASWSASLPIATTAVAYVWLAPRLGTMKGAVVAYMVAITAMVIGALAVLRNGAPHGEQILLGASLFYVSDLSVASDRFVRRAFVNRAWGLPAYYAGQLLLTWATA